MNSVEWVKLSLVQCKRPGLLTRRMSLPHSLQTPLKEGWGSDSDFFLPGACPQSGGGAVEGAADKEGLP